LWLNILQEYPEMKIYLILLAILSMVIIPPSTILVYGQRRENERKLSLGQGEKVETLPVRSKRFALIIGVDQYQDTQITTLGGASNDAKTLADALVQYAGFPADQVILLASDQPVERQPNRGNILRRLSNLVGVMPEDGMLLVSFAGHGMERGGQAFLLPSDAQVSSDVRLLEETSLNVERVKRAIKDTGVKQVMLILDACRNDPAGRASTDNPLTESYTRGFNFDVRNREVNAFVTLFATSPGQRAYEYKEKKQGYFTYELVEALKGAASDDRGEVTLNGLIRYLQREVPKRVQVDLGKEQKPYAITDGYKADELVISIAVRTGRNNVTVTANLELEFWNSIKESNDAADYRAYLEKYPNGEFVTLAKNRIKRLETPSSSNQPAGNQPTKSAGAETSLPVSPTPSAGEPPDHPASRIEFVRIPAGEFLMGSNNGEDDEKPAHRVRISRDFEIGKYEVTQAQWEMVMGSNPSYFQSADRPVERVSWDDVQQFIQILNSRSRKYNYRLPTEAEWEYACRAGSTGDYAGDLESMAWYGNNSGGQYIDAAEINRIDSANYFNRILNNGGQTHPVGQKRSNAWGLYDMHGNVWEWCHDWYGPYSSNYQVDPQGPGSGSYRVYRGGSFFFTAATCRSAFRDNRSPGDRYIILGFRLVRTPR
jgi:formylglycine-generating enzyme required for sulfatase activity